jgi:hypothetical protein
VGKEKLGELSDKGEAKAGELADQGAAKVGGGQGATFASGAAKQGLKKGTTAGKAKVGITPAAK